jgi:hypothetical protein
MAVVPLAEDINAPSESNRSGKVSLWKSERDARGNAVPSLPRCSGRQRTVSIKVRENEEVKEAAGIRPKVTPNVSTANLPLLARPIPAARPSIAPENVTDRPPEESGLLHFLAHVVVHEGERRGAAGDAPGTQLSAPPSTDRLKRADREEASRRCIFSDHESINEHYPTYVGKGTYNCPLSLINRAATKKGKVRTILDWRMLSPKQQREKLDALYDNQPLVLRERSGESDVSAQPRAHKKRRTLADDRDLAEFGGNESEWEKVLEAQERQLERDERRNAVNRQRTVARKKVSIVVVGTLLYHSFDVILLILPRTLSDDQWTTRWWHHCC